MGAPAANGRPRVLMLLPPGVPFGADWARAARTVADVVTLAPVGALDWPSVEGTAFVAREPSGGRDYQLRDLRLRPHRLLHRVESRLRVRRFEAALTAITAHHGAVDVLHTHYYPNARIVPELRRRSGIAYIHTEHSTRLTGASPHAGKQLTSGAFDAAAAVFRDAACVVPVSAYLRGRLVDQQFPGRFEVIGNPVDVELFRPPERTERDGGDIWAVSVGRLEADKGFDTVVQALALARQDEPRLRLAVVGEGAERAQLGELVSTLGLPGDAVRFHGRLTRAQIADLLRQSHVYVAGSRMETFGVAVAEAMACGLPVAATAGGSLPEVIGPDGGIVVALDDAPALAAAMLDVIRRRATYDPSRIADTVRTRFSYEAIGRRLLPLYLEAREARRR